VSKVIGLPMFVNTTRYRLVPIDGRANLTRQSA